MIPPLDATTGLLPVGIHQATLAEVHTTFVQNAPFPDERELVFKALSVYLDILSTRFQPQRVFLNGGFVTYKTWAAPKDADLAIGLSSADYKSTFAPENISAWTLGGVSVTEPGSYVVPKIQPMLGLVDGYFFPNALPAFRAYWEDFYGKVKDQHGNEIPGVRKGFVEVIA